MNIYIVKHLYDNGESYEDYREYEDYSMYSSYSVASHAYWFKVSNPEGYEGKYQLIEWELDTQEHRVLEESPWVDCSSAYDYSYDYWEEEGAREEDINHLVFDESEDPNPMSSIREYWAYEDSQMYTEDIPEEEDKAWFDYVNNPGTNYKTFKEVDEEIERRRLDILIRALDELLTL